MTVSRRSVQAVRQFAEAISSPDESPAFLDRLGMWLAISVSLVMIAYGSTHYRLLMQTTYNCPGSGSGKSIGYGSLGRAAFSATVRIRSKTSLTSESISSSGTCLAST
jgi:hypothetical protein